MKKRYSILLLLPFVLLAGCASFELGGEPYQEFNDGQWQNVYPVVSSSSQPKQKPIELKPAREPGPEDR